MSDTTSRTLDGLNRDPLEVLVDEHDPLQRSRAHTELGRRASARDDVDMAVWHLREAIDLDPTDETPREALRALGQPGQNASEAQPVPGQPGLFGRFLKGLRRRTLGG
jgi:Flp pilus assembly protein TadD